MRLRSLILVIFVLLFSCKAKDPRIEVEKDLKNAMQTYLYSQINNDSTNVKYRVQKVIYFEEQNLYICEFTVNLKAKLFDTTGIMKANISKDFKKVDRLY